MSRTDGAVISVSASHAEYPGFDSRYERRRTQIEYILSYEIRLKASRQWTSILPKVEILAGVEYRSRLDFATAGIIKLPHASETGNSSPASILQLGVVSQEIFVLYKPKSVNCFLPIEVV